MARFKILDVQSDSKRTDLRKLKRPGNSEALKLTGGNNRCESVQSTKRGVGNWQMADIFS